ncbi:unnamed protein product [Commensalibacter communis]|uniref:DUF4145 domain-containing protein n=1 Tax=Commensalibacter communis TaxID=2972786 RepID=A0A9W4TN80_9PROT|nr:hypothetical protein [Commensalibacter communis]CAI3947949.1 unnamed protein product [Commensalibacter communis]CAI3948462.1 unnamed protein product [Commensalibacter communis]CAI3950391.1 unnamed protein product [Commensalibacter communis]CAI3954307.1 unnamed protein product [Commensalibacter communis]
MAARENKFREELDRLIEKGENLNQAIQSECDSEDSSQTTSKFRDNYQQWYSLTLEIVKHILPSRLDDFKDHYQYQGASKGLYSDNYRIDDYCNKRKILQKNNFIIPFETVIPHFQQQLSILKATKEMLSSTLLDLKALVQADLFDSEIDIAKELAKKGFFRAAGAICGVVIEKHLLTLCQNHNIEIDKKHPTISDLCEPLKKEEIISQPDWRSIQFCADIRNLCCHNKEQEPTEEQVDDLIDGTDKIIKTIS